MKASIWKRKDTGKWMMSTMVEGKRYSATIGNGSQRWAQREADLKLAEMLEEAKRGRLDCTVGNLLQMWERYAVSGQSRTGELAESTIRQAKSAFLEVCELGAQMDMDSSLEDLTPAAVRSWHAAKLEEKSLATGQRRLASLHAKWIHAKSVFGRRAVTYYADMDLDVTEWARLLRDVSLPKGKVPVYDLPPDELVEATEKAGAELKREKPNLWVVYALGINCGLRAAEIAALRKSWVVTCRGSLVIELVEREGWKPKGTERMVPIHSEMWEDICKISEGLDTVLPGTYNARYQMVVRDFAAWMKGLGWNTRKKSHELRKLFGSRIYTDLDPAWAREYLGHVSMDTTTRYYAKLDRDFKLLPQR